jgi:hypothetical protein
MQCQDGSKLKYKTGDPDPTPGFEMLRFVAYDSVTGEPMWCSVAEDATLPYRLANKIREGLLKSTCDCVLSGTTTSCRPHRLLDGSRVSPELERQSK